MAAATTQPGYGLRIAAIHQDSLPQEWATRVFRRAIQLVGPRSVHTACWSAETLHDPLALEAAIEAAVLADVLVIAVSGDEALPASIDRWIDSWLPRRLDRVGALVAIIGLPSQASNFTGRIRDYLRDVATLAHLDFLLHERMLPLGYPRPTGEAVPSGVPALPHAFTQPLHQYHFPGARAA